MVHIKIYCILILIFILSGCAGISATQEQAPPKGYKEIRCMHLNGDGRYGTIFQYVKGNTKFFKLTMFGNFPENTKIACGKNGVSVDTLNEIELGQ